MNETDRQKPNQHNFRPNKLMGQNFLTNKNILAKIIQTADLSDQDTILEVGPGLGILTKELAQRAKRVIAVEKDEKLAKALTEELKNYRNLEIINGDILANPKFKSVFKIEGDYKIVANLPFYLTTPFIRLSLKPENLPQEMILMVQKEVGQRMCARPPRMNFLAVLVQLFGQARIAFYVSRSCFRPQPQVDSAVIQIVPLQQQPLEQRELLKFIRAGFSSARKLLANNLYVKLKIEKEVVQKKLVELKLSPKARAQELSVGDWVRLYAAR